MPNWGLNVRRILRGVARWILRSAIAIWLLFALGMAAAWIGTPWGGGIVERSAWWQETEQSGDSRLSLAWNNGVVQLDAERFNEKGFSLLSWLGGVRRSVEWQHSRTDSSNSSVAVLFAGQTGDRFHWVWVRSDTQISLDAQAPFWTIELALLVPLVAVIPFWKRARRQRFRRANKLCLTCGYDLRESLVRCPECGTEIPQSHRAGAITGTIP